VVARELTKHYEEIRRGTAAELHAHYAKCPPKGEVALLIAGGDENLVPPISTPAEEVAALQRDQGYSLSDAIKEVAVKRNINKSSLYREMH
jgi:16S rRNA (cytidine1402-2'-O)-methyltransferase